MSVINLYDVFRHMKQEDLKKMLLEASDHYYNKSEPTMSDQEFDEATKIYAERFPTDDFVNRIGAKVGVTEWEKATHKIPMCSLNKVNTQEEFIKWSDTIGDSHYIIMDKLDGISVDLEYENGKLVKAITRGDGIEGENILNNVRKMKNVLGNIKNFTGSLRGEIIMLVSDFEKLNFILMERCEKEMKNPRNAASGISKRYDGTNSEYLTVLYYDITGDWETEEQKLQWLKDNNIKTCYYKKVTVNDAVNVYNDYEDHLRAQTKYDIDGLVVKCNNVKLQKILGELNGNPKAHIAWKFGAMKAETILENIEWQTGSSGRITPVAILKPVKVGGVVVTKASLHNLKVFNELKPYKNAKVLISRRGDVIPQIEKIIE